MRMHDYVMFAAVIMIFALVQGLSAQENQLQGDKKDENYTVAPKNTLANREARMFTLIDKLDARTAKERSDADALLAKIATKKDIAFLEKSWKKSKSVEQKLRIRNILIGFGWIPPKSRKKIKKLAELLKSPKTDIRKKA